MAFQPGKPSVRRWACICVEEAGRNRGRLKLPLRIRYAWYDMVIYGDVANTNHEAVSLWLPVFMHGRTGRCRLTQRRRWGAHNEHRPQSASTKTTSNPPFTLQVPTCKPTPNEKSVFLTAPSLSALSLWLPAIGRRTKNEWLIQGCYPYWRPLLKACNSLQQKRPGAPGSRFIKPWRHCFKSLGTYLDIKRWR